MHAPEDRYTDVGAVRTRYWEDGSGDPVLLIHGLGASVETWRHTLPCLAQSHQTLALDLIGFGYSGKPSIDYTHETLANFVLAFLDTQGITTATLVGHSLGGSLALRLAIDHPERVRELVLVDSVGIHPHLSLGLRLLTLPLIGELLLKPNPGKTRQALQPLFYDETRLTDDFVALNYDLITQPGAQDAYLSTVRHLATPFRMRQRVIEATVGRLDKVLQPTLILWGAEDAIVPVSHARTATTAIAGARLHIIDQCGHLPMLECPQAFNTALTNLGTGNPAPSEEAT